MAGVYAPPNLGQTQNKELGKIKNFSLMVLAAVVALALAPAASAETKGAFYVTPKIGFSSMTGKVEGESASRSVVPFGLAVGYDFNPVRAELEYD